VQFYTGKKSSFMRLIIKGKWSN